MAARVSISFADSAVSDLQDILAHYEEESVPDVGKGLVSDIIADIELLKEQPDMGRVVSEFEMEYLRELIRPPFRIVYRRDKKRVRIVRAWRSERLMKVP